MSVRRTIYSKNRKKKILKVTRSPMSFVHSGEGTFSCVIPMAGTVVRAVIVVEGSGGLVSFYRVLGEPATLDHLKPGTNIVLLDLPVSGGSMLHADFTGCQGTIFIGLVFESASAEKVDEGVSAETGD